MHGESRPSSLTRIDSCQPLKVSLGRRVNHTGVPKLEVRRNKKAPIASLMALIPDTFAPEKDVCGFATRDISGSRGEFFSTAKAPENWGPNAVSAGLPQAGS